MHQLLNNVLHPYQILSISNLVQVYDLLHWIYIKKSQIIIVFSYFITWNSPFTILVNIELILRSLLLNPLPVMNVEVDFLLLIVKC
jgi:hypothetical protein